jgi:hypothetical protein
VLHKGVFVSSSSISPLSPLAEGMSLLNYRQKIIKIADSSDLGWRVVQEYEANPLADDSEDEKKLLKAESRAERKVNVISFFDFA